MEYDSRLMFDPSGIDLTQTMVDLTGIQKYNRHRGESQQIDRIVWHTDDYSRAVAGRLIRDDEWWCAGHIPGKPIFPAVMMIEASAQVTSFIYQAREVVDYEFVGFTGIENTVFRAQLEPGDELFLLANEVHFHTRRFICDVHGMINGKLAFETRIKGMPLIKKKEDMTGVPAQAVPDNGGSAIESTPA